ncbi:MAG TPA: hypothetical protein DCO72_05900 [Ruminococcus sp.]|nr:hypothetical protein [Ruminococcus sp.]
MYNDIFTTGIICISLGIGLILVNTFTLRNRKRHCTESVNAVCTGFEKEKIASGRIQMFYSYAPEWEYTFEGVTYRQKTAYLDERLLPVRIGQKYEIHINPNHPKEIDFEPDNLKIRQQIGIGAFLVFFGGVMLFLQYMGW